MVASFLQTSKVILAVGASLLLSQLLVASEFTVEDHLNEVTSQYERVAELMDRVKESKRDDIHMISFIDTQVLPNCAHGLVVTDLFREYTKSVGISETAYFPLPQNSITVAEFYIKFHNIDPDKAQLIPYGMAAVNISFAHCTKLALAARNGISS